MSKITSFEDPWPGGRKQIPLEKFAVLHLQLVDIFLQVLSHFETDQNGRVLDEALVYSEWRYICYLRFLEAQGLAPIDHPPPWDVALIWYLHLVSPPRFHHHMCITSTRASADLVSYGLEHRHFPLTKLLSGEPTPQKTLDIWQSWNFPEGNRGGYQLPFHLWPPPSLPQLEEQPSRRSRLFSRLLNRNSAQTSQPPHTLRKNGGPAASSGSQQQLPPLFERRMIMYWWNRCHVGDRYELTVQWSTEAYTLFRTGQVDAICRSHGLHEDQRETCELRPWPIVQDLRADLERQVGLWKALAAAKTSRPGLVESIHRAGKDYADFIGLFHGEQSFSRTASVVSRLDPKLLREHGAGATVPSPRSPPNPGRIPRRLLPPTLEVDLLWRTHRMFPGSYWVWTSVRTGWVIDSQPMPGASASRELLAQTRRSWKERLGTECPGTHAVDEWFGEYIPDAATFAAANAEREEISVVVGGRNSFKERRMKRVFARKRKNGDGGGGDSHSGDGGGGGGGGDGGGGGGGGDGGC